MKTVTRTYTIHNLNEINIPWREGRDRDWALARREQIRRQAEAAGGFPYTYSVTTTEITCDDIELDL